MVWIVLLGAAALAILAGCLIVAARRSLAGLQDVIHGAWPDLQTACAKRAELVERIVAFSARPLEDLPRIRERVSRTGAAVREAVNRKDTLSLAAAEQAHRAAVAELLGRARGHPQLARSNAFAALVTRIATLDARIDVQRERYNDAASVFNVRRGSLPFRLAALAADIPRAPFL